MWNRYLSILVWVKNQIKIIEKIIFYFFIIIFIYYIIKGEVTLYYIIKMLFFLLFLAIYKYVLMCIHSRQIIPNRLIVDRYYESYLYRFRAFIIVFVNFLIILDWISKKLYNQKKKIKKLFFGSEYKIKEYESTLIIGVIKLIYYFPTNWSYLILMYIIRKYNMILLWLISNKDIVGKKYFNKNWTQKYPKIKKNKFYEKIKKYIIIPLYMILWIPSYWKLKIITLTWKEFFSLRIWGNIFTIILLINNLHPSNWWQSLHIYWKLLIITIFLYLMSIMLMYFLDAQYKKNTFLGNNHREIEKGTGLFFYDNAIFFESLYQCIKEIKVNNYYYIRNYLVFYQIYLFLLFYLDYKCKGFGTKNFNEIEKMFYLFKIPENYDYNMYYMYYNNLVNNEVLKKYDYNFTYIDFLENFISSKDHKKWEIIDINQMQWQLNRNYYPFMNLPYIYVLKLQKRGFDNLKQKENFSFFFTENILIWKWIINAELYKVLYNSKLVRFYKIEEQINEYEDLYFLYFILFDFLLEKKDLFLFDSKFFILDNQYVVEYEHKNREIIKYDFIPNNFISNKNYKKIIKIIQKFEYLANLTDDEDVCFFNKFDIKKEFQLKTIEKNPILTYNYELMEEWINMMNLNLSIIDSEEDFSLLNKEMSFNRYLELKNKLNSNFSEHNLNLVKTVKIIAYLKIYQTKKFIELLQKIRNNEEIHYEKIFDLKELYFNEEWVEIIKENELYKDLLEIFSNTFRLFEISISGLNVYTQEEVDKFKKLMSKIENYEKYGMQFWYKFNQENFQKKQEFNHPYVKLFDKFLEVIFPNLIDKSFKGYKKYLEYLKNYKFKKNVTIEEKIKFIEELDINISKKYKNKVLEVNNIDKFFENLRLKKEYYENSEIGHELHFTRIIKTDSLKDRKKQMERDMKMREIINNYKKKQKDK